MLTSFQEFVVDETSACLDQSEDIIKKSSSLNHFELNRFPRPDDEDYLNLADVLEEMVTDAPGIRNQLETCTSK